MVLYWPVSAPCAVLPGLTCLPTPVAAERRVGPLVLLGGAVLAMLLSGLTEQSRCTRVL